MRTSNTTLTRRDLIKAAGATAVGVSVAPLGGRGGAAASAAIQPAEPDSAARHGSARRRCGTRWCRHRNDTEFRLSSALG